MWREADRPPLLGLAGVVSVLYLLSQVGLLLPAGNRRLIAPLDGLLSSTSLATAVLLCLLGHLVARQLLSARRESWSAPLWYTLGWLASLLALLALVCGAVGAVSRVDSFDTTSDRDTGTALLWVMSLTWNEWLADHLLQARGDLTALWVFSVAAQLVVITALVILLLGRRQVLVGVLALVGAVAAAVWRAATYEPDTWVRDSLATAHHADAFLCGVAVAALAPRVRLTQQTATEVCGGLGLILVGGVLALSFWSQEVQAQTLPAVALLTAAFCLCADHRPSTAGLTIQALSAPRWQSLATTWPFVLAWSYPVVITVGRRSFGENRYLAALVALAVVLMMVRLSTLLEHRAVSLVARARPGSRHDSASRSAPT